MSMWKFGGLQMAIQQQEKKSTLFISLNGICCDTFFFVRCVWFRLNAVEGANGKVFKCTLRERGVFCIQIEIIRHCASEL